MRIQNVRIGTRMGVALAGLMILMLAMFAVTLSETERSRANYQSAIDDVMRRKVLIDEGKEGLLEAGVAMRNIGLVPDVDAAQREEAIVKVQRKRMTSALQSLAGVTHDEEASRLLRELQELETRMAAPVNEAVALALAFSPEGAVKVITAQIDPLYRESLDRMRTLVALESKHAAAITQASAASAARLRNMLLAGCSVTLLLSALIGAWLTRSVTLPIRKAVSAAHRVAGGDLSSAIESDRRDEIGDLLRSLGNMADMLKTMLSQVRDSADSIAIATREVAAGTVDLSSRTEEAASQTQATVGVIDALGKTALANADHTREATQLADTATGVARYGGEVVSEVVGTMARITESSKKIADITSVIDGIAFQTNILALNAAVEAARAGEQGRGFAVVAGEVRALAQRSAAAAREIKGLITASAQSVQNGAALVDKAGGAMEEIVSSVLGFHEIIGRVRSASDGQAGDVELVRKAIGRIDDATQRNAALVEQSAAASSSLHHQTDQLRLAVGRFKV